MVVSIPWVDRGCPYRRAALSFVLDHWARALPDARVELSSPDPFSWGSALNAVAEAADDDAVVVHSDPDSVVPAAAALRAVELARSADGLVVPFDRYLYLTEDATREVVAGVTPAVYGCHDAGRGGVGNVTVYRRSTWLRARGYDERFGTWGGADGAFSYACSALVAPLRRLRGAMLHCWHPRLPESVPGGPGYADQFAIVAEYRDAAAVGADAVRDLVERREVSVGRGIASERALE